MKSDQILGQAEVSESSIEGRGGTHLENSVVIVEAGRTTSVQRLKWVQGRLTTGKHDIMWVNIYLVRQSLLSHAELLHSPLFPILTATGISPNVSLILSTTYLLLRKISGRLLGSALSISCLALSPVQTIKSTSSRRCVDNQSNVALTRFSGVSQSLEVSRLESVPFYASFILFLRRIHSTCLHVPSHSSGSALPNSLRTPSTHLTLVPQYPALAPLFGFSK